MSRAAEATEILRAIECGDRSGADRLTLMVYDELRQLARNYLSRETSSHTLQPTALVHEAFMKLIQQRDVNWQGRSHFLALGAQAMRRILVDHARTKKRLKRGAGMQRWELDDELPLSTKRPEDVLALDAALDELAALNPVQAAIVELRFFGGMTIDEIALSMDMSKRTVERHWTMVRAWLRRELAEEQDS